MSLPRRWFQLSLKSLFLLILLVAVFFGGYMAATRRLQERMDAEREARRQAQEARTAIQEELDRFGKLWIVVFRHHPGKIHALEESEPGVLRTGMHPDAKAILQAAPPGGYGGGLGSGYELSIRASDLGKFKTAMDQLINSGTLQYYRWGLDKEGYGLVPVR